MDNLDGVLTIVIPVKDEARNLPSCLESVRGFRHVVVVDSGSTDGTLRIAADAGREVVQFVWNGHFPKKRNWMLRNYPFKTPWVMFLDADERMPPAFLAELSAFLASDAAANCGVIVCSYDNWFAGRMLKHGDVMRKTAIVRVGTAEYERIDEHHWSNLDMEIHEHIQPVQKCDEHEISARLEHHDRRSMESHWKKHVEYANWEAERYRMLASHPSHWNALTPRQRMKYGYVTKWWMAPAYFVICYVAKLGFMDGLAGFRFARLKYRYFRMVREKILTRSKDVSIGQRGGVMGKVIEFIRNLFSFCRNSMEFAKADDEQHDRIVHDPQ